MKWHDENTFKNPKLFSRYWIPHISVLCKLNINIFNVCPRLLRTLLGISEFLKVKLTCCLRPKRTALSISGR